MSALRDEWTMRRFSRGMGTLGRTSRRRQPKLTWRQILAARLPLR